MARVSGDRLERERRVRCAAADRETRRDRRGQPELPGEEGFLKEERLFLETFAGFCALALERTRAYASERVAHGRTERLQRYTARLAPALTVADVGEIAVNKALVASGGVTSLLALETADGRHLEIRHVEGRPAPERGLRAALLAR